MTPPRLIQEAEKIAEWRDLAISYMYHETPDDEPSGESLVDALRAACDLLDAVRTEREEAQTEEKRVREFGKTLVAANTKHFKAAQAAEARVRELEEALRNVPDELERQAKNTARDLSSDALYSAADLRMMAKRFREDNQRILAAEAQREGSV